MLNKLTTKKGILKELHTMLKNYRKERIDTPELWCILQKILKENIIIKKTG